MTAFPTDETLHLVGVRDGRRCALCGYRITGLRGRGWSLHHRRPRAMGGTTREWVNLPGNLILLCGSGTIGCHSIVESDRAHYYANGFLIRDGVRIASEVPIEHRVHGFVLLDDLGGLEPA